VLFLRAPEEELPRGVHFSGASSEISPGAARRSVIQDEILAYRSDPPPR
jgi:hypothetical protein